MAAKDFILKIEPAVINSDTNVAKFSVHYKYNRFLKYVRIPLIIALSSWLALVLAYYFHLYGFQNFHKVQSERIVVSSNLFIISIIIFLFLLQEPYDSMIVMKNIGVQLNSYGNLKYFGKNNERNIFIPQKDIIDLVIHEGFLGFGQVVFYMCILVKNQGNDDIIKIVFPSFLPRKILLEEVWRKSRTVLFGSSKRYWRRVPGQGLRECKESNDII